MATGRNVQLTKQVGEYLVASELARRGYVSSTFSGNVPDFDIVATNQSGTTRLIQVKTINGGSWQFSIDRFATIEMEGNNQIIGRKKAQPIEQLIFVLVKLGQKYGEDEFYILKWNDLQDILMQHHREYLAKHNGERPLSKKSMHCGLQSKEILKYQDNWSCFNQT
jgi:hypothetical protein